MPSAKFKISSALKDLLGRELITDRYVAVFELVKNSADANASLVLIRFEYDSAGQVEKIIIEDNGCGMDADDIRNKWLFVGYSEKRPNASESYRDRIRGKRAFAGAKGVGRFSCDRLGTQLHVVTRKAGGLYNEISVDWGAFEKNSLEEFGHVQVNHKISENLSGYALGSGTIIEITGLRDTWSRKMMLTLKHHLMKLVNPLSLEEDAFRIELEAEAELQTDEKRKEVDKVNGLVRNFVFDRLDLKTIGINVRIDEEGRTIRTELTDRGKRIYTVVEWNDKYSHLHNVAVNIYHLNSQAKEGFYRLMSIYPVNFGSIFVYKNGFRIYPYGEPGDDALGIDRRKQQGFRRYLGSRDVIGQVALNGEQLELNETTSRSGGIIQNSAYDDFVAFIKDVCLRRLERYAVDVVGWGEVEADGELEKLTQAEQIALIIKNLVEKGRVISLDYDSDFLETYNRAQADSSARLPEQLTNIASGVESKDLASKLKKAAHNIREMAHARKKAEVRAQQLAREKETIAAQLERREKQVLFLSKLKHPQVENFIGCYHSITSYACAIENWLKRYAKLNSQGRFNVQDADKILSGISEANKRILALSRMVVKANFNPSAKSIHGDLVEYVDQYIKALLKDLFHGQLDILCNPNGVNFEGTYTPLEIAVVMENLAFNSAKARATRLEVSFALSSSGELIMSITDDGRGLDPTIVHPDDIFSKGFTTTDGSGWGLYQVRTSIEKMGGHIAVDSSYKDGLRLNVTIK